MSKTKHPYNVAVTGCSIVCTVDKGSVELKMRAVADVAAALAANARALETLAKSLESPLSTLGTGISIGTL